MTLIPTDIYAELKAATTEDLILATAWWYEKELDQSRFTDGLRMALKIMQPDGWWQVAPAWLREYRRNCQVPSSQIVAEKEGS